MIEIKNLNFCYENSKKFTLKNINLKIEKGEFISFLGDNGSGKSTLAKHLNGLLIPVTGDVLIKGMNTKESKFLPKIRKTVGIVFQNPHNQIICETVEEDIRFGCKNIGISSKEIERRVEEVISYFGLEDYRKFSPNILSAGKLQILAIAGCVAMEPECIVLDEPTSMLDCLEKKKLKELIKRLNKEKNITIIYITQNPEDTIISERILFFQKGEIIFDRKKEEFFKDREVFEKFNLKIPDILFLSSELKKSGIDIENEYLEEKFLWQLKSLI
jgi:energy-coupling factor transport system ATP-binding protein